MAAKPVCIAESFGYGSEGKDYTADINGDGENEFICNCFYAGDGVRECRIYKRFGSEVREASGSDLIPDDIIAEQTKSNNIYSVYIPETNKIICGFVHNNEVTEREYGAEEIAGLSFDKVSVELHTDA